MPNAPPFVLISPSAFHNLAKYILFFPNPRFHPLFILNAHHLCGDQENQSHHATYIKKFIGKIPNGHPPAYNIFCFTLFAIGKKKKKKIP